MTAIAELARFQATRFSVNLRSLTILASSRTPLRKAIAR
jgi:hypothetical protein